MTNIQVLEQFRVNWAFVGINWRLSVESVERAYATQQNREEEKPHTTLAAFYALSEFEAQETLQATGYWLTAAG